MSSDIVPISYKMVGFNFQDEQVFNHDQILGILNGKHDLINLFNSIVDMLREAGQKELNAVFVHTSRINGKCAVSRQRSKIKIPIQDVNQVFCRIAFKADVEIPLPAGPFDGQNIAFDFYDFMHGLVKQCSQEIEVISGKPRISRVSLPSCYENLFQNGVYKEYRTKMKAYFQSIKGQFRIILVPPEGDDIFKEAVYRLVTQIYDLDLEKADDFRELHRTMVTGLRSILGLKDSTPAGEYKDQAILLIEEITCWIFEKAKIKDELQSTIKRYLPELDSLISNGLTRSFGKVWNQLTKVVCLKGSRKTPGSDLHSRGSLIYNLWHYDYLGKEGKTTQFIRMSNPTIASICNNKPQIISELIHFLRVQQRQGKSFLYVNLMVAKGDDDEVPLSNALHELETEYDLTNITVISLDRNSDAIRVLKDYIDDVSDAFVKDDKEYRKFLGDHVKQNGSNRWSPKLDLGAFKSKVQLIIDNAHYHYFKGQKNLIDKDREDLNELVNMEIVDDLIGDYGFDFVAIGCRATVDRGPSLYTLLYIKHLLKEYGKLSTAHVEYIYAMLFSNGILTENRLINRSRAEVFRRAAARLIACGPMTKVKIANEMKN